MSALLNEFTPSNTLAGQKSYRREASNEVALAQLALVVPAPAHHRAAILLIMYSSAAALLPIAKNCAYCRSLGGAQSCIKKKPAPSVALCVHVPRRSYMGTSLIRNRHPS